MKGETIMAYKMISTNGQTQYGIDEFVIDSPDDLEKLPKRSQMGSAALCLSNGAVYMKDSNGEWKEV